jgi:hypothetical protein
MYARALRDHGETVTVERPGGPSVEVRARIMGYSAEELVSGITQGDRKAILLAEDLERAGFPGPIRRNDRVVVRGRPMNVESVDDSTRRIGEVLIAYELGVTG